MMKPTALALTSMLAAASVGLAFAPASQAIVAVNPQVTGRVTAIPSSTQIEVDGRDYLVAVNSPAFTALKSVRVGDVVGLTFDGSPQSSASHVITILDNGQH